MNYLELSALLNFINKVDNSRLSCREAPYNVYVHTYTCKTKVRFGTLWGQIISIKNLMIMVIFYYNNAHDTLT